MTDPVRMEQVHWRPMDLTEVIVLRATVAPADVPALVDQVASVKRAVGVPVQLVRADRVLSHVHVHMAAVHAARAEMAGRRRADDPAVEWLLYAAADRQIRRAVEALGVPLGAPTEALVVLLGAVDVDAARAAAGAAGWTDVTVWDPTQHEADVAWWDARLAADDGLDAAERETRLLAAMALLALDRP